MGLDWNRIARLHNQVMSGTHELTNSITLFKAYQDAANQPKLEVVGSNPIWDSVFFRVLLTFNLSFKISVNNVRQ